MNPPGGIGEVNALVEFIVNNPGLSDALISEHIDDGRGHCRACALGAQRGYYTFPCDIRCTAERAREIERSNRKLERSDDLSPMKSSAFGRRLRRLCVPRNAPTEC
jgi:hypothetical protein